ncbi:hypothetical protein GWI33_013961 [Rhynchophorus ferrugineus]|uniref:Uncharacterized protein n=1 Tax=Rhynchophorus ferrugineus TaxID=354439 RepID=A0A834M649_RHYFE|nr:hypothetical protein GWI33_013961 [Rhynchophorus ferrugineus]
MSDQQKDEHVRHLEAQIAILQNQVSQLINTKMTTGETDNDMTWSKTTPENRILTQAQTVKGNFNLSAEKKMTG